MSILNREMLRGLASTSGTGEPEAMAGEMELESRLQDVLFSELFTSVCYWSVALLLAIVGAGLVYWRLTHFTFAEPVSDPFGVTTPPWLIVALPPFGIAASLSHGNVACSPRPTCVENAGHGRWLHRGHGRDHAARNTFGSHLKRISRCSNNPKSLRKVSL